MARDPKIKRRLVCNWDKADKMFYCIVQKWDDEVDRYKNSSYFEVEKIENCNRKYRNNRYYQNVHGERSKGTVEVV